MIGISQVFALLCSASPVVRDYCCYYLSGLILSLQTFSCFYSRVFDYSFIALFKDNLLISALLHALFKDTE